MVGSLGAQIYHKEVQHQSQSPDRGGAKNFNHPDWTATSKPYVRSELTMNGQTYAFIRYGEDDFKLARKENGVFAIIAGMPSGGVPEMVNVTSTLLGVSESNDHLHVLSWGVSGYIFYKYKKTGGNNAEFIQTQFILNLANTFSGVDISIKSLKFIPPNQLKITKDPTEDYPETDLLFEFKPDGVYKNGVPDLTASLRDIPSVIEENLRKNPKHYEQMFKARQKAVHEAQNKTKQNPEPANLIRETKSPSLVENSTASRASSDDPATQKKVSTTQKPSSSNCLVWIGLAGLTLFLSILGFVSYKKKFKSN